MHEHAWRVGGIVEEINGRSAEYDRVVGWLLHAYESGDPEKLAVAVEELRSLVQSWRQQCLTEGNF